MSELPPTPATPRKRRKKRRAHAAPDTLSINSLMDIVSIILVYLIGTYASSPIEVTDPSIELPTSTSQLPVEDSTVVMISGMVRKSANPDNPLQSVYVKNVPWIVVDGKKIVPLDINTYRVPDAEKDAARGNYVILKLREALREAREIQAATAEVAATEGFTGKVIILADKNTPYRVLTDVLVTASEAGFGEFRFAIIREDRK